MANPVRERLPEGEAAVQATPPELKVIEGGRVEPDLKDKIIMGTWARRIAYLVHSQDALIGDARRELRGPQAGQSPVSDGVYMTIGHNEQHLQTAQERLASYEGGETLALAAVLIGARVVRPETPELPY